MILLKFNNRNDNFGDQLISYLLYKELCKHDVVNYINTKPEIVNAKPLRIRKAFSSIILSRLKGEKVILIDPPCARVYIENFPKPSFKNRLIDLILNFFISERYVLSISIDPRINATEFNIYNSIGVRDTPSFEFIKQHHNNVVFTPDMACLLPTQVPKAKGSKTIISFRENTPDNNYSSDYSKKTIVALTKVLSILNTSSQQIDFYSQVEEDDEYNKELSGKITNQTNILKINKHKKELYYQELFNDCNYVISNRLHVLLPAMIEGVLAIALLSRSHKKIIDLLTTYGLDKTIVYIDAEINIETKIQEILRERDAILLDQYEKLKKLNNQLKDHIEQLIN